MAIYPGAIWRGPISNRTSGGMVHPVKGLVLHIEEGSEAGTDSWFHNPAAQASAHFGVAKDGTVHQWVDTDDKAWAEAQGNPYWYSVENEGYSGQSLTAEQIESIAQLFVWLSKIDGFPLQLANTTADIGLGHHAMGGAGWGGHLSCPGDPIIAQKQDIVDRAIELARPQGVVSPMYDPALNLEPITASLKSPQGGVWLLTESGAIYAFDAPYHGAANGQAYFVGRKGARLEPNTRGGYDIIATSGERYSYPT